MKFLVPRDDRCFRPVWTLVASNSARPSMSSEGCLLKNFDFPIKATLVRVGLVERSIVKFFVLKNRKFRFQKIYFGPVFFFDFFLMVVVTDVIAGVESERFTVVVVTLTIVLPTSLLSRSPSAFEMSAAPLLSHI